MPKKYSSPIGPLVVYHSLKLARLPRALRSRGQRNHKRESRHSCDRLKNNLLAQFVYVGICVVEPFFPKSCGLFCRIFDVLSQLTIPLSGQCIVKGNFSIVQFVFVEAACEIPSPNFSCRLEQKSQKHLFP